MRKVVYIYQNLLRMHLKVIQGSYRQGDGKFGDSAGKQCTCCSLFSVAFTLIKTQGEWNTNDLEFIVEKGDLIYKSLNVNCYLAFNELPKEIPFIRQIL